MKIKYLSTVAAASLLSLTLIACGGGAKTDGCAGAGCAGKEGGCAGKTEQPAEEKPAE